ncbi:sugar-binding transcriptional regulator [Jannaschia aquimarina]|uniref:LsrR protein n=1 Tax=Jannaschia aquimarina TaxID=935700 RepID=A0A0D1D4C8_9RHOB|nr:sugar-binding domain-containing protein [Jannaschia aquimarina]KIT14918.1 Transcriptional regulator LsrR [Jannaschia aquimarina]SNS59307.1 DNA-binding transcriptional regulator LsrR, DeoR family [Jannaschia aquimarina]
MAGEETRVRVAWLYHVGGLSQDEVGKRLGLSRFKVLRLLSEAREAGLVRVTLDHENATTLALAEELRERFGLSDALVAPDPGSDPAAVRRAVGTVAARWLDDAIVGEAGVLGVGWGRTLAAMADAWPGGRNPDLRVVSLMGAMVRTGDDGPIDVCARIAASAGGQALFLPAPFLADTPEDAARIQSQRLVREALDVARTASRMVISVGEGGPGSLLSMSGVLDDGDLARLAAAGAVADTTGKFFREDGTLAPVDLNERAPSIGLDDLRRSEVTMLAAGTAKRRATRAVLRAGFVDRLIADETLATALMEDDA